MGSSLFILNSQFAEQQKTRDYLLGRMPEEQLAGFEERLLTDHESYEELLIVEDELVDEYLHDELPAADRVSFETHFMSAPDRQGKLRFARALKKLVRPVVASQTLEDSQAGRESELVSKAAEPKPKKRSFFEFFPFQNPIVSYALAAALVIVVSGVFWMGWRNWQGPSRSGPVFAIELSPQGITRDGGELQAFVVPPTSVAVRLQLDLAENKYSAYEVLLLDDDGRTLLTKKDLKPQSSGGRQTLSVETETLPPGDYRVKLNGVNASGSTESVAGYSFRIKAR